MSLVIDKYIWIVCVKDAGAAKMDIDRSMVKEYNVKRGDFWDFLSKLELISWLILYEAKSSFFLHAICKMVNLKLKILDFIN